MNNMPGRVIWGDDIGQFNVSAYNMGMMGYKTPNIDRIASEGAIFTDWYGQQTCTAGRAAFITGQSPIRTGLTKVGLPGAPEGMKKEDPTIATLLKAQGYMTGQFGKNHLGDRDEMLPTAHGFDEFFGNLYHLNAEEEPENPDYPKDPEFKKKFGPRGVIHSFADGRITDTGPLTRKRMETIDEEVTAKALDFMERAKQANKPFFIWWNSTRMHIWTHLKTGVPGQDRARHLPGRHGRARRPRRAGAREAQGAGPRREHDRHVLDRQRRRDDELARRRHHDVSRREEHELGGRLPRARAIRWPGVIKPGTVINDIGAHEDMLPTLLAAAGDTTVVEDLKKGRKVGDMTYKVHLDGYNLMPALKGEARVAAQGVHLLDRRRQRRRAALQQLEDGVPRSSGATGSTSGRSRSSRSACRSCSTCAATPSSGRTTKAWATRWCASTACSSSRPPAPTSASGCRASRSFRRARSPAASTSTT